MTVREIENIVRTLCGRHADLDGPMLSILLRAGGWEDSLIRDALSIFTRYQKTRNAVVVQKLSNPSQKEKILPVVAFSTPPIILKEKVLAGHGDALPLEGGALSKSPLPKTEDVSLLPEMVSTNRLIEGHQEEVSKNEYEESLLLVKEALQKKVTEEVVVAQDGVMEDIHKKIIEQENETAKVVEVTASPSIVPPKQEGEEIVYFTQDGHLMEEETPVVLPEAVSTNKEISSSLVKQAQRVTVDEKMGDTIASSTDSQQSTVPHSNDPQSLIVHDEPRIVQQHDSAIPENLPMRPFESSPHVVPFSKYKEAFYKEETASVQSEKGEEKSITAQSQEGEGEFKKAPLSKGDESIAILAGVMLLVIMLLLGYMYGNGRL
jgi:hypothetical protein